MRSEQVIGTIRATRTYESAPFRIQVDEPKNEIRFFYIGPDSFITMDQLENLGILANTVFSDVRFHLQYPSGVPGDEIKAYKAEPITPPIPDINEPLPEEK